MSSKREQMSIDLQFCSTFPVFWLLEALYNFGHIHPVAHQWQTLPCKVPVCSSGARWGSVSCSRTLWHAAGGAGKSNPQHSGWPALPLDVQLPNVNQNMTWNYWDVDLHRTSNIIVPQIFCEIQWVGWNCTLQVMEMAELHRWSREVSERVTQVIWLPSKL